MPARHCARAWSNSSLSHISLLNLLFFNMNRLICCSLVGASLAISGANSNAQSMTLYGELDTGLAYVSNVNGHTQYLATSGLIDGSFLGVQGTEELGEGTQALFRLERGFSVTSGEDINDHPAYVGLQSDRLGTLTLGHQYDLIHDYFQTFTLTGGTGGTAFAHPFDNDNANNSYLAANAIKYASASYGGFTFGGMYAFSNTAGRFAENRAYGIATNYAHGPFSAGVAWMHNNGRGFNDVGAFEPAALPGSGGTSPPAPPVDASAQKQDIIAAGANYVIGDITLAGAWSRSIYTGVADIDSGAALPSVAFSNYEISAVWLATPTLVLAGMYVYSNASSQHWHQGALQADYQLSKRTDVYVEAVYQRASAGTLAVINSIDPSGGRNQLLVATGIRHRF
jgi:general bacterial porin, GBP family